MPKHKKYEMPKNAWISGTPEPKRPFQALGTVRTKVNFVTLNFDEEEGNLCDNYFKKAIADLLKRADEQGADGVIRIQSVVFLEDGRQETYSNAECSDDGAEGQILAQGVAIRFKK